MQCPHCALFVLPHGNTQIHTFTVDIEEKMKQAGLQYLYVTSFPSSFCRQGDDYRYPLAAVSSKGGVTYRLESGPKDMKIDDQGVLTWKVPGDASSQTRVEIAVADTGGQVAKHSFTVRTGRAP